MDPPSSSLVAVFRTSPSSPSLFSRRFLPNYYTKTASFSPNTKQYRIVTPKLYGNLVANTAAGIAGGTGFMPGDHAVFEQGASAGNVGNTKLLNQKKANPVALLLSSAMMLRHLQFPSFADRLETAVKLVIAEGKFPTKDLGGDSSTQEVVDAVIAALE